MSKIENSMIHSNFKLPIFYHEKKIPLKKNIISDLELINNIDSSCNPVYHYLFDPSIEFSKPIMEHMSEYYTDDIVFLKENQQLLKSYIPNSNDNIDYAFEDIINIWDEIKNDTGFKEKYSYIDWPMWEFLNKSESFLQLMSVYNLLSPVISLFIPIIILIIPFFVIHMKGISLSISEYIQVLKIIISQHAIGKLFSEFNDVPLNTKFYLLFSACFYVFSIYQNILVCIRFNQNMMKIHSHIEKIKEYIDFSIKSMNNYLQYSSRLKTEAHNSFNEILKNKISILEGLYQKLSVISQYKFSFQKVFEIGHILKCFYEIYQDKVYEEAFLYSFGYHGYINCLEGLIENIKTKKVNFAVIRKQKISQNVFHNNYYGVLKNDGPVKNKISLKKNIMLTGPNASGKTTILKSVLINIIFTQQFGCGFYDSAKFQPYQHIHCYLNIPDTSGRDSLFQAEARRCKEIIDHIQENPKDKHFCVFDELYSGTNPEEAVTSAYAFLQYLRKHKSVQFLLTTHFVELCKQMEKDENIINLHMKVLEKENNIKFTYLLEKGISVVKGAWSILSNMNYPKEILESTKIQS